MELRSRDTGIDKNLHEISLAQKKISGVFAEIPKFIVRHTPVAKRVHCQ